MSLRCRCGSDYWVTLYDYVPYGATVVSMAADGVCAECGRSYDDAIEWCDACNHPEDDCMCGRCEECGEWLDECSCREAESA